MVKKSSRWSHQSGDRLITVRIAWKLAWEESALVALDEWSSYRGVCLSKVDCMIYGKGLIVCGCQTLERNMALVAQGQQLQYSQFKQLSSCLSPQLTFTCSKSTNTNTRKSCEICSKLIKSPERHLVCLKLTSSLFCTFFQCFY